MTMKPLHLAAAAAAAATLGFGGVSLASAQEDTTTTVPSTEEAPATPTDEDCPHGQADTGADTSSTADATSL